MECAWESVCICLHWVEGICLWIHICLHTRQPWIEVEIWTKKHARCFQNESWKFGFSLTQLLEGGSGVIVRVQIWFQGTSWAGNLFSEIFCNFLIFFTIPSTSWRDCCCFPSPIGNKLNMECWTDGIMFLKGGREWETGTQDLSAGKSWQSQAEL